MCLSCTFDSKFGSGFFAKEGVIGAPVFSAMIANQFPFGPPAVGDAPSKDHIVMLQCWFPLVNIAVAFGHLPEPSSLGALNQAKGIDSRCSFSFTCFYMIVADNCFN